MIKKEIWVFLISVGFVASFVAGMFVGAGIIWKNFQMDQVAIKEQIAEIQKDEPLAHAIIKFLEELQKNFTSQALLSLREKRRVRVLQGV